MRGDYFPEILSCRLTLNFPLNAPGSVISLPLYELPPEIIQIIRKFTNHFLFAADNREVIFAKLTDRHFPFRIQSGDVINGFLPLKAEDADVKVAEVGNHLNIFKCFVFHIP